MIVGRYKDDNSDTGSAYVFRYDGIVWNEEQKLTASDESVGVRFGRSVSISGNVVAVGTPWDDSNGSDSAFK